MTSGVFFLFGDKYSAAVVGDHGVLLGLWNFSKQTSKLFSSQKIIENQYRKNVNIRMKSIIEGERVYSDTSSINFDLSHLI